MDELSAGFEILKLFYEDRSEFNIFVRAQGYTQCDKVTLNANITFVCLQLYRVPSSLTVLS